MQECAVRPIAGLSPYCSNEQCFIELNILKKLIVLTNFLQIYQFMYQYKHRQLPSSFNDYFPTYCIVFHNF